MSHPSLTIPHSGRPGRLSLAVLLLLFAVLAPWRAEAATAAEIEAAVDKVLAAGDYQRELPLPHRTGGDGQDQGGEGPLSEPDWWRDEGDAQAQDFYRPAPEPVDESGRIFELPKELVDVLRVLGWVVLLTLGALVLYYLVDRARSALPGRKGGWQDDETAVDLEGRPREARLEDYDRLAAAGDYAGAIHALLLHCIAVLRDRGGALSASLTSRELLRRLTLEGHERDALATLVRITEVTHFGGREASDADFRHCRDLYHQLASGGSA